MDFNFGCGFVPPKNLQYFIFILKEMKKVRGRTKLFKIHSLIEEEGRVKYNLPIDTYPLGPVDYEAFDFCKNNALIEDRLVQAYPYEYYETYLTERGRAFFKKYCEPNMQKEEVEKARKIIKKYRTFSGIEILAHVHKKYVDPFKKRDFVNESVQEAGNRIRTLASIVENKTDYEKDGKELLLSEFRHLREVLKSLKDIEDPNNIGAVLVNLDYFLKSLEKNGYKRNPLSLELFEFIDNYADKEGIHKSIASDDFSDIPEDERERLVQTLLKMRIPQLGCEVRRSNDNTEPSR